MVRTDPTCWAGVDVGGSRKGFHLATQQTFDLEAKPCVRYHVAAKLANSTSQDWKPVIRSQERIHECEAKFKVAGK